jgi:hypothetical protein
MIAPDHTLFVELPSMDNTTTGDIQSLIVGAGPASSQAVTPSTKLDGLNLDFECHTGLSAFNRDRASQRMTIIQLRVAPIKHPAMMIIVATHKWL